MLESLFFKSCGRESCNFIKKETPIQLFSCEPCKILKNTFFNRIPPVAAAQDSHKYVWEHLLIPCRNKFLISSGNLNYIAWLHYLKRNDFLSLKHWMVDREKKCLLSLNNAWKVFFLNLHFFLTGSSNMKSHK